MKISKQEFLLSDFYDDVLANEFGDECKVIDIKSENFVILDDNFNNIPEGIDFNYDKNFDDKDHNLYLKAFSLDNNKLIRTKRKELKNNLSRAWKLFIVNKKSMPKNRSWWTIIIRKWYLMAFSPIPSSEPNHSFDDINFRKVNVSKASHDEIETMLKMKFSNKVKPVVSKLKKKTIKKDRQDISLEL